MIARIFKLTNVLAAAFFLTIALSGCGASSENTVPDERAPGSERKASAPAQQSGQAISPKDRDPNRLWCNEHGLYEDECVICHPEIANKKPVSAEARDSNRLWCNEHGVYEDECYICHPELKGKKEAGSTATPNQAATTEGGAVQTSGLFCKEHQLPESECGNCRPEAVANLPVGKGLKVRFASGESTNKAGVAIGSPISAARSPAAQFLGQVTFNRNQFADVTPLAEGVVLEVLKDVGQRVEMGEVLTTMQSTEIATVRREIQQAQAEGRRASQTLAREQDLHVRKISPRQDVEAAQAEVAVYQSAIEEGRQHLLALGLTKEEVAALLSEKTDSPTLPVRAPFAGTIVERNATRGQSVRSGDALFQIADLSTMWMEFSIPENQIAVVSTGTTIDVRFDAYPGLSFDGEVEWIGASIDTQTRMVKARAVLANSQGILKDGLFARVTIRGAMTNAGLSVPESAIQDVDGRPVIFRKLEDDLYETLPVELGAETDGQVVVLAGLAEGDLIVTQGSYVVKSELLKGRLGAGCTDH
ncbi:MAG: efflux RND transporter periplasmic adaptor subunit [Candidatus Hydrogenedentes bacterium]|nr:efflux RND transporter periplasmic adaptor subunit [Candidatus Hydrogenedentota bacterium]